MSFPVFSFTRGKNPRRRIAPKAIDRLKKRVRELTRRTRGIRLERRIAELNRYLKGRRAYFGFCQTPSVLRDPDSWIRRRLRSLIWKQMKHGRRRFAELKAMGVGKDLTAQMAGSPHGPWRVSRNPALHYAFNITYALGLASLELG